MATIIRQREVCDGLDVDVVLTDGRARTFHAVSQPADVQAWADSCEIDLMLAEIALNGGAE